jgi:hypothetical protein
MNPELIFLHIPKAAGTSQRRSFRQYYGPENIFWIGDDCPGEVRRYPREQVGERLLVGGHKPLSFYPRDFDPLYCAVLRDPVERAISLFAYYTQPEMARSENERKVRQGILNRLLKEGIDPNSMFNSIRQCRSFRQEISNMQCAYISNSRANFKGALKSLRQHDFVLGSIKHYGRFHRRLGELLEWPNEEPDALNRSKENYASAYLDLEELVALLHELNAEDSKLMDFVVREHDGLYERQRDPQGRQKRLCRLPLRPWMSRDAQMNWGKTAGQLWPTRANAQLPWPRDKIFVSQANHLLYMAIPGPAIGIVRRLMLDSSAVQHQDAALGLGLGRILARFETGLMLGDRSGDQIEQILEDDAYFRFSVLHEPVTRLIDVYTDKFVVNRAELVEAPRLAALVAGVAGVPGRDTADVDEGISFREFVAAILGQKPQQQHWLWAQQFLYLRGLCGYDKLYRPDQLTILQRDLEKLRGFSFTLPAVAPGAGTFPRAAGEGLEIGGKYADCRAADLPRDPSVWRSHLLDAMLRDLILEYYARDCELYNSCVENEMGA